MVSKLLLFSRWIQPPVWGSAHLEALIRSGQTDTQADKKVQLLSSKSLKWAEEKIVAIYSTLEPNTLMLLSSDLQWPNRMFVTTFVNCWNVDSCDAEGRYRRFVSNLKEGTATSMADTHQLWVCPDDSWEENASGCPLKSPCWPLTWKSYGRLRLLSRDAQGLCFFRRSDLSSDHGSTFADAALSPSSLSLHIAPLPKHCRIFLGGVAGIAAFHFLSWQVFPGLVLAPSHLDIPTRPLAGRLTSSFPLHAPATLMYGKYRVAHVILLFMNCQSLHCL